MRISTAYQYGSYSQNIAKAQERYMNLQNQVSTGRRLNVPSDDPAGTASFVNMRALQSANERFRANLETGATSLKFSENALDEMHSMLQRAYQLAVSGANSATDQPGRVAMASEVRELQRRFTEIANSRGPNQEFIFSGQMVDTKPFTESSGALVYNGDSNSRLVESGPGETLAVSVNAGGFVVQAYSALESLRNNLESGNPGAIAGIDITALQNSMTTVSNERGVIGSKLQQIERLRSDYERRNDEFTKAISDIEDVDMAEAVLEYRLAESAYTAALNVAGQGFRLSLLDFITG